ncbi:putative arginine--tRNA ligase, mitochondrial [Trichonephila clavata]|uniref:Putative arginine--tRNA ligase, mitochondrial n=1 Tax=Trichonephila clavata TaxID=2740835 RepID=A0A8X6F1K9_TRICU|nr:putative arginine--tRNA ligase, mitochondrial [Trichonephila clavata]
MASVFRRRITNSVISILQPFLKTEDNIVIYDTLPLSLKLSQPKLLPPQFELSWKDVVKLKPELQIEFILIQL